MSRTADARKFTDYDAVMIAEGAMSVEDEATVIAAWQHLIDTGLAWRLQGWFGRAAMALIDQGVCTRPARMASEHEGATTRHLRPDAASYVGVRPSEPSDTGH